MTGRWRHQGGGLDALIQALIMIGSIVFAVVLLLQNIPFGMLLGAAAVLILCKIELPLFGATIKFGGFMPDWWPKIAWSWYVLVGCVVTFAFCVLFRTPQSQVAAAEAHVGSARIPGK